MSILLWSEILEECGTTQRYDVDSDPPSDADRAWWAEHSRAGDPSDDPDWSGDDEDALNTGCPCDTCEMVRRLRGGAR